MPESKAVGIIDVLSLGLKNTLLPSPTQCLQQSQQLLPTVAHEKCTALLTELKESTAQFKVPDTVEEFVKIKNFLSECQENLEVLEKRYQFVAELYRLMRDPDNGIKIPESDKANLEKLEDIRKRFARAMAATTDNLDTHTDRFVTELREKIPLLQEKISEVEGELQEPMIANTKANVKTVIEYLQGCDENLESLEQRAEKYQYYQEVLSVEVTPYEGLRERRADMKFLLLLCINLQIWEN
jgi:archaellum component FlaC